MVCSHRKWIKFSVWVVRISSKTANRRRFVSNQNANYANWVKNSQGIAECCVGRTEWSGGFHRSKKLCMRVRSKNVLPGAQLGPSIIWKQGPEPMQNQQMPDLNPKQTSKQNVGSLSYVPGCEKYIRFFYYSFLTIETNFNKDCLPFYF